MASADPPSRWFPPRYRLGLLLLAAFQTPHGIAADLVPREPAGQSDLLKEDQRRQVPPRTAPPKIDVVPDAGRAIRSAPGLKVEVKAFRFTGVTAVPAERLQEVVQKFVGPDRTFDDLQAAADAVSEYLQQQGYVVAQAYLPEQSLEGGVVQIAVLEGRLAELRLEIDPDAPISRDIVEGLLSPLTAGTVMNRDVLERSLFLVSDLRGINVRSSVEAGAAPGTSNLLVKISAARRADGLVEFDNHSSRFTGRYRLGAGLNVNSPFRRGDLLSFRGVLGVPGGGADLDFARLSYLTPIGNHGTKVGAAYLRLQYRLGTTVFDPVDQHGTTDVASLFALHPFVRSRNLNVFGQVSFDAREFVDDRRAVAIRSERKSKVGTFSLVGDSRDVFLGGGINNFALGATLGDLDIESAADRAADQSALGRRTLGRYQRYNITFTRVNAITNNIQVFASTAVQWASKNLDASEKIGLGGPNAVRAYAVGEATSDEAALFTAEVRYAFPQHSDLPGTFVASAFYDWGRGRLQRDPLPLDPTNTRTLRGAGIGLTWARVDDFVLRATLAWRLSGPPMSDPEDRRPRLYFQAQKNL